MLANFRRQLSRFPNPSPDIRELATEFRLLPIGFRNWHLYLREPLTNLRERLTETSQTTSDVRHSAKTRISGRNLLCLISEAKFAKPAAENEKCQMSNDKWQIEVAVPTPTSSL